MPQDLRTFLAKWEQEHPEDVVRVSAPVDIRYNVAALQLNLERQGVFPIIIFEHPTTVEGGPSPFPVITNLMASRRRCAAAIGSRSDRIAQEYQRKISGRIPPEVVSKSQAPVKEVIDQGAAVNLLKLPIPSHHENSSGPEITGSYITTCDPDTGVDNTGCQRGDLNDRDTMALFIGANSHNARNLAKWWSRGEDAPFAMWIGHHPGAVLGGQVKYAYQESHWDGMGGLLGEPLRLVPTETWGERLMVPADAEIVIEGVIPRETWTAGGQFGDWARYLIPSEPRPVGKVTCITHRRDAYFFDIVTGCADHQVSGSFAYEGALYAACKLVAPEVVNVHMPLSGMGRATAYIQVKDPKPGNVRAVISAALARDPQLTNVFVVDDDVDIFDDRQVWWAFSTRTHLDKDLLLMENLPSSPMNPVTRMEAGRNGLGTKMGVDCTLPQSRAPGFPRHYQMAMRVPQQALEAMKVSDYVPADKLRAMLREA